MAESFDLSSLIEEFRDEARDQVDRLDAGLLELEREGALDAGTRSDVLRTLHTLKGNAGMLGLGPIRDYVHAVENAVKGDPAAWSEGTLERLFEGATALRRAVDAAGRPSQEEAFRALGAARHRLEQLEGVSASAGETGEPEEAEAAQDATDVLRVPFEKLDSLLNEVGELLGETDALSAAIKAHGAHDRDARERAQAVHRRADRLRETALSLRLVPMARVLGRFPGLLRRVARDQGKEARLILQGEETEVDKSTADALTEPLLHLVRNAVDHGIEPPDVRERAGKPRHGTVAIRASQEGDRVRLVVEDDGAGLALDAIRARARELGIPAPDMATDEDAAALVFRPGFSTRTEVSTVSGRGVGLDVVRRSIRALRGELALERRDGGGTRFVISLPLTVAIVPSLVFQSAGELLAMPASAVEQTVRLDGVDTIGRAEVVRSRDDLVPLARPDRLFGWPEAEAATFAVVVRFGGRSAAITAERLVDQRDLVVKAVPAYGRRSPGVSGVSVLPGGGVILVLDAGEVIELNLKARGGAS